jgi:hypothetical protein
MVASYSHPPAQAVLGDTQPHTCTQVHSHARTHTHTHSCLHTHNTYSKIATHSALMRSCAVFPALDHPCRRVEMRLHGYKPQLRSQVDVAVPTSSSPPGQPSPLPHSPPSTSSVTLDGTLFTGQTRQPSSSALVRCRGCRVHSCGQVSHTPGFIHHAQNPVPSCHTFRLVPQLRRVSVQRAVIVRLCVARSNKAHNRRHRNTREVGIRDKQAGGESGCG